MVLEPTSAVFRDMVEKAVTYDGGDQSFLNEYFKVLMYAPLFNWSDSRRQHQPMRLPPGVNADALLHYYYNHFGGDDFKVVHFTMNNFQPWVWWTHRLCDLNRKWVNIRKRLPSYGHTPGVLPRPIFWAPYPLIFICFMALRFSYQPLNASTAVMRKLKYFNGRFSHFIPLPILCLAYFISFNIVPTTMLPSQAEYVF